MNILKNAGYQFVFCRATEGTSGSGSRDEKYHINIANAKAQQDLASSTGRKCSVETDYCYYSEYC